MAERRMFSKTITNSARFLMMPVTARLLYYDLGMSADDDGVVEAFSVIRLTGASEDDLRALEKKGFVTVLNDELVSYICDWKRNNFIRGDRYQASVYAKLIEDFNEANDNQRYTVGIPNDNQRYTQDRLGKDSIGKDRLGEGKASPTPITESEKDSLISEGISERYIDERIERASDYARAHKRRAASVLREWWTTDKEKYAQPESQSFDTDDFFEAALARSIRDMQKNSRQAV